MVRVIQFSNRYRNLLLKMCNVESFHIRKAYHVKQDRRNSSSLLSFRYKMFRVGISRVGGFWNLIRFTRTLRKDHRILGKHVIHGYPIGQIVKMWAVNILHSPNSDFSCFVNSTYPGCEMSTP